MQIVRYHFDKIDSTNNWVKAHIGELDIGALTLVTADEQTAGRGRLSRRWVSLPKQGVFATFAFFTKKQPADIGNISLVMAICAAEVLGQLGFEVRCKWPNDLLLSGKKVGGILCETLYSRDVLGVVVGVGINVNMTSEAFGSIEQPATSLFVESGHEHSVGEVIDSLADRFKVELEVFLNQGFGSFLPRYRDFLIHRPGQPIRFSDNRALWEGSFDSLQPDGSIAIRLPNGAVKLFRSGECLQ